MKQIQTFKVDWTSIAEIRRYINLFTQRTIELGLPGEKLRQLNILDNCNHIYNKDISHLYTHLKLDETRKYYVYAHCNPLKKLRIEREAVSTFSGILGLKYLPFYIGKGTDNRAFIINRNETYSKIKQQILQSKNKIEIKIIKDNLTECEALCLESKLIDIFGLITYSGCLTNLDEGVLYTERRNLYSKSYEKLRSKLHKKFNVEERQVQ